VKKATKKIRVVFEKVPGSDIWWICYFDANGRKRREKVGRKGAAIELYRKRKTEIMEGKKLPNPARLVPQRKEKNARIRFLSTEEERVLRQIVQTKYWSHLPELDLALNTGLRLGEQYGLSWECVDFQRRTLTIPVTKNGECRHVPLNDAAIAALEAASKLSSDQPWVFLNRYAERLVSPREWFDPAAKEAGLQGFTWALLASHFREPACDGGGRSENCAGTHGSQNHPDDSSIRTSGPQTPIGCGATAMRYWHWTEGAK